MPPDPLLAMPVQGLVASKYELVQLIGRGGMGSVWEGRHITLGSRVAIKFIEAEYVGSEEARTRFDNEARAAATIQSKHAIQIFDHGVTEDAKPYIVMEYLEGEPLDKRLERVGKLSLQETARILQQICRALQRAHDKGIVHRDLKPENIFLVHSQDDDDEIAKVLDFGIAKFKLGATQGISSSTKTGAILGTPFYMSPEQARGLRSVDHRTDIWSLGVIAFRCVTGVLPFDGESVGDLLVKICTGPIPSPTQLAPELPHSIDAWSMRVLDRDPEARFASAQDLAEKLALISGVTIRRGPRSAGSRGSLPEASPGYAPAYTPPGPSPGATQSPFTSAASGSRTLSNSKGVLTATIGAAVVGASIGVFAILKWNGGRDTTDSPKLGPNVATTTAGPTLAPSVELKPENFPANTETTATGTPAAIGSIATDDPSAPPLALRPVATTPRPKPPTVRPIASTPPPAPPPSPPPVTEVAPVHPTPPPEPRPTNNPRLPRAPLGAGY